MNEPQKNKVNFDLKLDLQTLIILGVFLYLFFVGFFEKDKHKVETKTTTKVEIIKQFDSLLNNRLSLQPPKPVRAALKPNKQVRSLQPNEPLQPNETEIELNEVKDTLKLTNATIFSTMLTDGKIYSHKAIAQTNDKLTTINNETKEYIPASITFLNVEPIFNLTSIKGAEISLDRTIKNKFRFGIGAGYNDKLPVNEKFYLKAKLGIKW